jgi:hypothetical protein
MIGKLSGVVLLLAMIVSPQLVAGGEPRYPILDSKFPAAEAKLGWIDNERIIFHGYDVGKMTQPGPGDGYPTAAEGLFIWDAENGAVTKYWDIEGPVPLCVFRGQVFFTQKLKEKENTWLLVSGPLGKEEQQVVSTGVSMNGHNCRVSDHRPSWMKEDKHRRLRLLDEHGYLDFGVPIWADPLGRAMPIVLYRPDSTKSVELPLTGWQVQAHTTYFEFASGYLLKGEQRTPDAVPLWLLRPDGIVIQLLEPKGKAWERIGWTEYVWTIKGLFLISRTADGYAASGKSGGYLLERENPERLIVGLLDNVAVSPNGCRIAFVHVLNSQVGADSFKELRAGRSGSRTLKMIDLCAGKGE